MKSSRLSLLCALTFAGLLATPAIQAAGVVVRPAGAEWFLEFETAYDPDPPCVDWEFAGRNGDTLWVRGLPPPPLAGCPADNTVVLGQLPPGRYRVLAQLVTTGEIYAEIVFWADSIPPPHPEITVSPARPSAGEPVRVAISMVNTICAEVRFDTPPTVDGDRIKFAGQVYGLPILCPPVSWNAGFTFPLPPLSPGLKEIEFEAEGFPYARMAFTVEEPAPSLLLRDRFQVDVLWWDALGAEHVANAVPLTAESGQFWFFRPANTELTVKILDGTGVNGHFWVFAASMTDLRYRLRVTDTSALSCDPPGPPPGCAARQYESSAGTNSNVIDTLAFPALD